MIQKTKKLNKLRFISTFFSSLFVLSPICFAVSCGKNEGTQYKLLEKYEQKTELESSTIDSTTASVTYDWETFKKELYNLGEANRKTGNVSEQDKKEASFNVLINRFHLYSQFYDSIEGISNLRSIQMFSSESKFKEYQSDRSNSDYQALNETNITAFYNNFFNLGSNNNPYVINLESSDDPKTHNPYDPNNDLSKFDSTKIMFSTWDRIKTLFYQPEKTNDSQKVKDVKKVLQEPDLKADALTAFYTEVLGNVGISYTEPSSVVDLLRKNTIEQLVPDLDHAIFYWSLKEALLLN